MSARRAVPVHDCVFHAFLATFEAEARLHHHPPGLVIGPPAPVDRLVAHGFLREELPAKGRSGLVGWSHGGARKGVGNRRKSARIGEAREIRDISGGNAPGVREGERQGLTPEPWGKAVNGRLWVRGRIDSKVPTRRNRWPINCI